MSRVFRFGVLGATVLATSLVAQSTQPLVGRLVDPDGKPIGGVLVEAWHSAGQGTGSLDLEYKRKFRLVASCRTKKGGRILLRLPVGMAVQLRIDHPPFARFRRDEVIPGVQLRAQLAHSATFSGRVVRASDGKPVSAVMRAWRRRDPRTELFRGRTGADGSFVFDRLAPGKYRVSVTPDAAMRAPWTTIDLEVGKELKKEFAVRDGQVLRGRVIDAVSGKPIAGADIGEGWTFDKRVRTDADGRYVMRGFGASGYGEAFCRAAGYVQQSVITRDKKDNPLVLDFRLTAGLSASGAILDASGKPLAGVYVAAVGMVHDGKTQHSDWLSTTTDGEGRFRIAGLRESLQHVLFVRHHGWATLVFNLPDANEKGVKDAGKVRMRRPRVLHGQLFGADRAPLAHFKVGLWGTNGDRERHAKWVPSGPMRGWDFIRRYAAKRIARTDARGRFTFGDLPDGTYGLVVYDDRNQKLGQRKGIKVAADEDPEPLEITIDR